MASPKVPFVTYRIQTTDDNLTADGLREALQLDVTLGRLYMSLSRSWNTEHLRLTATVTVPDHVAEQVLMNWNSSVASASFNVDNDFRGFTPLSDRDSTETGVEYVPPPVV